MDRLSDDAHIERNRTATCERPVQNTGACLIIRLGASILTACLQQGSFAAGQLLAGFDYGSSLAGAATEMRHRRGAPQNPTPSTSAGRYG